MRVHSLFLCALIAVFPAMPAFATECANVGTAPSTAPDDTDAGDATACGDFAVAGGQSSTALGHNASSAGDFSTALGYNASSGGNFSYALGVNTSSAGSSSTAIADNASSAGNYSIAIGLLATSEGVSSIALGANSDSTAENSAALGYNASSTGGSSTAIGENASSPGEESIALGRSSLATGNRSAALGNYSVANQPDTVILGAIAGVNTATTYAKVGIGTSAPAEAVDVERSSAAARFQLTSFTDNASEAPQFIQRRARGTSGGPGAVQNNDNLGLFSFRGHNGTAMGGSRATITAQAAGTFSASSTPTRLIFATTPVGSTAPQSVLVITPDGKVQVKGVNLNVPDYVFEDDYALMPLDELKAFIDENGHLPGMASAREVNEEGLDLAGSQMGLLQKVEELTLYTLQQERRFAEQESRLETQQARIAELEAQQHNMAAQEARIERLESQLNRALATLD